VHVWSDIACPWCFLGKRRFERAARDVGGAQSSEVFATALHRAPADAAA
jgi:predicted DsbA family dithiol-disulfide isomerase